MLPVQGERCADAASGRLVRDGNRLAGYTQAKSCMGPNAEKRISLQPLEYVTVAGAHWHLRVRLQLRLPLGIANMAVQFPRDFTISSASP